MRKGACIARTPARFDSLVPQCKQCLESSPINPATGSPFSTGREHVVRFMGAWACRLHYMIENTKTGEKTPLKDMVINRQHRRQLTKISHGIS